MGKFDDLGLNFAGVEPGAGSKPIPNGWQHVRVERWYETETGDKSKNPGSLMYKLGVSVASGTHEKRWVFTQFVLDSHSEMIETNIGQMKQFLEACGISRATQDTEEFDPTNEWAEENLIGKELDAYIVATPAKDGYEDGNTMRKFRLHEYTSNDMLA